MFFMIMTNSLAIKTNCYKMRNDLSNGYGLFRKRMNCLSIVYSIREGIFLIPIICVNSVVILPTSISVVI